MDQLELPETVEEKIVDWLKQNRYTLAWLSRQVKVSEAHLHNILKTKSKYKKRLKPEHLLAINQALGTQFKLND